MSSPLEAGKNPYGGASFVPLAPAPIVPAGPLQTSIDYMRSYNYIFENPNWLTSVLLMGLIWIAAIIPGVGIILNLLVIGYQFEIMDWLLKSQGRQYPTFDFNRFGDYLSRGLWPFLVNLIATIVLLPVIYITLIVGVLAVAGLAGAAGDELGPVIGVTLGAMGFVVFIAMFFVAMFYLGAMMLRSGLAQEFGAAFQFDWIQDFVSRMWLEMFLAGLFLMATGIALEILGLLAFCIGLFFVLPLIMMASAHLMYQLYVVYLSRGGIPVPTKVMMQPAMMPPPMAGVPPGYPPKPL